MDSERLSIGCEGDTLPVPALEASFFLDSEPSGDIAPNNLSAPPVSLLTMTASEVNLAANDVCSSRELDDLQSVALLTMPFSEGGGVMAANAAGSSSNSCTDLPSFLAHSEETGPDHAIERLGRQGWRKVLCSAFVLVDISARLT